MTSLRHAGAASLLEDADEGRERRLGAGQLLEVASDDALDGHAEHARGRGIEHADAAALIHRHGRGLHVQQDCALKLVLSPTSDAHFRLPPRPAVCPKDREM